MERNGKLQILCCYDFLLHLWLLVFQQVTEDKNPSRCKGLFDIMSHDQSWKAYGPSLQSLASPPSSCTPPLAGPVGGSQEKIPCSGSHSGKWLEVIPSWFWALVFFSDVTLILIVHIVLSQSKCSLEMKDIKLVKKSVPDSSPDLTVLWAVPCTLWVLNKY